MIRVKNSEFRMKNFILIALLLLSLYTLRSTFYISSAYADDATASADLKAKLEQLKQEIASRAAKLKEEVSQKLQNRAYVGLIQSKTANSLTLSSETGTKIVSVNQDTVYENQNKKIRSAPSFKILLEQDRIAALGDIDDTGVLTARKIVLLPPDTQEKTILWGQITAISDNTLTIKDTSSKDHQVSVDKNTDFEKQHENIAKDDLKEGNFVIVSGFVSSPEDNSNQTKILNAGFIYVVSQGSYLPKTKNSEATPSSQKNS